MRVGGPLSEVVTSKAAVEFEGESQGAIVDGGWATQQNMSGFLGRWSNDYQLLWLDGEPGQALSFDFIAPGAGTHLVYAGFTAAEDFGAITHSVNGQTGDEIDLYSTIVLPTGAVYLGLFELTDGLNNWRAEVTGANPNMRGSRYGYGLDYILLVPDAEVPLREINAGLNDAWFSLETDGQGFFFIVFPEIKQMFMAWFTYDIERPPVDVTAALGEPGHRWLTAQGGYEDNVAVLDVYETSGGEFDSPLPVPVTEQDGEITVEFNTCNSGTVIYDIPSIDRRGIVPIRRIALDNVPLCYSLDNQPVPNEILESD
jgi:hypothetical protein